MSIVISVYTNTRNPFLASYSPTNTTMSPTSTVFGVLKNAGASCTAVKHTAVKHTAPAEKGRYGEIRRELIYSLRRRTKKHIKDLKTHIELLRRLRRRTKKHIKDLPDNIARYKRKIFLLQNLDEVHTRVGPGPTATNKEILKFMSHKQILKFMRLAKQINCEEKIARCEREIVFLQNRVLDFDRAIRKDKREILRAENAYTETVEENTSSH